MTAEPVSVAGVTGGAVILLGANAPLLLDGADRAWVVQLGAVEIFALGLLDGRQAGPRRHVFTAQPGCILFGWELLRQGSETALLAVGLAGTQALEVSLDELRAQSAALATQPGIAAGLDAWVTGLSDGLDSAGTIHVHTDNQLLPETEVTLQDGGTAGPKDGVIWVMLRAGKARFLDQFDGPAAGDPPFPLAQEAWCKSDGPCTLFAQGTAQLAGQDALWNGLETFHRAFLSCWAVDRAGELAAESQRLQAEIAYERSVQAGAVADLAEAMDRRQVGLRLQPGVDPLLEACRLVGAAMGIEIRTPESGAGRPSRPLEAIAKASRVRTRRVLLTGRWWRDELGPLLAYTREGAQPVALIPSGRRGYTAIDPTSGTSSTVGPAGPALAAGAVEFYRPLPPRPLTGRELLRFGLRGGRGDLLRLVIMGVAAGVIALFIPIFTGFIFGEIIPANEPHRLVLLALALAASVFAAALFQIVRSVAMLRIGARVDSSLQPAIWDRLLSLPVPFFRQYTAGDLANRALGLDAISQVVTGVVATTVLSSAFSVFSFFLLFAYSLRLALVALLLTLVTLAAIGISGYVQLRYTREQAELQGKTSGIVLQFLTGIAKLRVAGAEARAFAVWAQIFGQQRRLAVRAQTASNVLNTFLAFWPVVTSMALFTAIATSPEGSNFGTATYLAFAAAFGQFLAAMLALGVAMTLLLQVVPFWERAQPILKALPEVDEAKADPGLLNGAIEVRGVSFRYSSDGPLVLQDVTIEAQPGEFVALVGPSGSGKTSMLRLLLGFERPETGSIYYDGRDLADMDTEAVRRQTGTVIQSGKLQTGSIFDNIIGAAPLTMDDAWEAAKMSGLDEDIQQMPMGMQTVISEGASNFSGGQRQRLLIARAVVGRPRILLFDEATSALDNRTQSTVTESLKNLQATRIVIAHRLSTIQEADRIYVIVAGHVVQHGTYEELMAVDGPFAQLARRQIL